jgi:hypothetical protein
VQPAAHWVTVTTFSKLLNGGYRCISAVGVTFRNDVISECPSSSVPREAVLPWGLSAIVKMRMNVQEDVHTLLCVCLEASDRKTDGKSNKERAK